eukprot:11020532-Prorocentrum_lima.AAC.1
MACRHLGRTCPADSIPLGSGMRPEARSAHSCLGCRALPAPACTASGGSDGGRERGSEGAKERGT